MPDIMPTAGDLLAIQISAPAQNGTSLTAKLMAKGADGKWEVELPGDPPMRGKVSIERYEWSPLGDGGCWRKREMPRPKPPQILDQPLAAGR